MSNNDLYCSYCKTNHHPVECPKEEEDKAMNKEKAIEYQEIDRLEGIVKAQARKIKELSNSAQFRRVEMQQKEIEKLEAQLADDKDGCIESCVEVAELRKENDDLREQLHDKVFKIMHLEKENKELKIMLVELQEEYQKLKAKRLSKSRIEEIMWDVARIEIGSPTSTLITEAIYKAQERE